MNKTRKLFFSAEGKFANTTTVYAWSSKKARDQYVADEKTPTCRQAIYKNKVGIYAANWGNAANEMNEPKPFTSQYWGIVAIGFTEEMPAGFVGEIMVCDDNGTPNGGELIRRLW